MLIFSWTIYFFLFMWHLLVANVSICLGNAAFIKVYIQKARNWWLDHWLLNYGLFNLFWFGIIYYYFRLFFLDYVLILNDLFLLRVFALQWIVRWWLLELWCILRTRIRFVVFFALIENHILLLVDYLIWVVLENNWIFLSWSDNLLWSYHINT